VTVYRDVKRGQVFAARYADPHTTVIPTAMSFNDAKTLAGADPLIEAVSADVCTLAKMAISAKPADHPADPLYARAPDAKLPGGITPNPQPA
jgi:tRNA threonylcarbamoyladenosine biosynthesis protein TsaB